MPSKRTIRSVHQEEYCALKHAIDRCHNPRHVFYDNYGGRGITVADEYRHGTLGFYRFIEEVGLRPGPQYSLDRINNDRGYEPGNLRWATRKQQQNNRRSTMRSHRDYGHGFGIFQTAGRNGAVVNRQSPNIHHAGVTKTLLQWARDLGIASSTLRQRLMKNWPLDVALSPRLFTPNTPRNAGAPINPALHGAVDLLDASITAISSRLH